MHLRYTYCSHATVRSFVSWETDVGRLKFGVTFKIGFKWVQMTEGNSFDLLAFWGLRSIRKETKICACINNVSKIKSKNYEKNVLRICDLDISLISFTFLTMPGLQQQLLVCLPRSPNISCCSASLEPIPSSGSESGAHKVFELWKQIVSIINC